MTNYMIEFPGLGLTLNPPVGFSIGPLEIRFYGLVIALVATLKPEPNCVKSFIA